MRLKRATLLLLLLCAHSAHAQVERIVIVDAPPGCISEEIFEREIRKELADALVPSERKLLLRITPQAIGFIAELILSQNGELQGSRTVSIASTTCDSENEALVLIGAILLERGVERTEPPVVESEAKPEPPEAKPEPPTPKQQPERPEPPTGPGLALGLGLLGSFAATPRPLVGPQLLGFLDLQPSWGVFASGAFLPGDKFLAPHSNVGATLSEWSFSAGACAQTLGRTIQLRGCLGAGLELFYASGVGLTDPRSAAPVRFAASSRAAVAYFASPGLGFEAAASGAVAPQAVEFFAQTHTSEERLLLRLPPASFQLSLGILIRK
jgi:hypothetical protein